MQIDGNAAEALVGELQTRREAGADEAELVTYLCNRFAIGKQESWELVDSFRRGFQSGAKAALDSNHERRSGGETEDLVFQSALSLGRASFQLEMARRGGTEQPRRVGSRNLVMNLARLLFGLIVAAGAYVVLGYLALGWMFRQYGGSGHPPAPSAPNSVSVTIFFVLLPVVSLAVGVGSVLLLKRTSARLAGRAELWSKGRS